MSKKLIEGKNDLASQYPEVALDWDYSKNAKKPNEVFAHSPAHVFFKCHICGHTWETQISKRTNKKKPTGCPKCVNHGISIMETSIAISLRLNFPETKQTNKIEGTEFDIYVPELNLLMEYDGIYWHKGRGKEERDAKKEAIAENNNFNFLRIKEEKMDEDFKEEGHILNINTNLNTKYALICNAVLDFIAKKLNTEIKVYAPKDIDRIARSVMGKIKIENSLAAKKPEVAKEWDYAKNGEIKPENIPVFSHFPAYWICPTCKQSYRKEVHHRTYTHEHNKGGCKYCSGQSVLAGTNDLATIFPRLKKFWDFERNTLKPTEVRAYSDKKVYWKNMEEPQRIGAVTKSYKKYIEAKKNKKTYNSKYNVIYSG